MYYEESLHELRSFLIETVINMRKLKGVDLSSCLRMVLKVPCNVVETITPYIVPVLQVFLMSQQNVSFHPFNFQRLCVYVQVIFNQGLEDLPLACSGLEALQTWRAYMEPNKFLPILEAVIPLLNPYLQSKSEYVHFIINGK